MSTDKNAAIEKKKCRTPEFRVSYPHVFKAQSSFEGQDEKYSITMLFSKKTDLTKMKRAAHNAAVEKWGADKTKWPKKFKWPFRDGAEREDTKGYKNCIFVAASSKTKPGLLDRAKNPIEEPADFYAGCYAHCTLIAFAFDKGGNRGVGFALQNIQKLRDGEPLSARKSAEEEFEEVEGEEDDADNYESEDESDGGDGDEDDDGPGF